MRTALRDHPLRHQNGTDARRLSGKPSARRYAPDVRPANDVPNLQRPPGKPISPAITLTRGACPQHIRWKRQRTMIHTNARFYALHSTTPAPACCNSPRGLRRDIARFIPP
ncbi:hypothetical protein KCP75_15855 [Salmonella enterica subsp. enterica]|nr:hypothetical protein KCP75_15855 [Salmonella enterica subsp. enterica]